MIIFMKLRGLRVDLNKFKLNKRNESNKVCFSKEKEVDSRNIIQKIMSVSRCLINTFPGVTS